MSTQIENVGSVTFVVAPGDPSALRGAAVWHEQVSEQMGAHADTIGNVAAQATSRWSGDAAASYAELSTRMHAAFKAGEYRAGDTAQMLHSISGQLAHYQDEGKHALKQATHWVEVTTKDIKAALKCQTDYENAKTELANARAHMTFAGRQTGYDSVDPTELGGMQTQVAAAETKVQNTRHALEQAAFLVHEDNQTIDYWNRVGAQAWEDARQAVQQLISIPVGPITPPPMPGTPVLVPPPASTLQQTLGWVQDVLTDLATVAGVATAFTFWIPGVGEVTGTVAAGAGAVSAATGWMQYFDGSGSLEDALIDSGGALAGGGSKFLDGLGNGLEAGGDVGTSKIYHAVSGQIGGAGAVVSGGEQTKHYLDDDPAPTPTPPDGKHLDRDPEPVGGR